MVISQKNMIDNMNKYFEIELKDIEEKVQDNNQKEKRNTEDRESVEKVIDSLEDDKLIKSLLEITDNALLKQKDEIEIEKEELLNQTNEYKNSLEVDEHDTDSDLEILNELQKIGIDVSLPQKIIGNRKEKILFYKEQLIKIQEKLEGNGDNSSDNSNYSFHWDKSINHSMEHERGDEEHPRNERKVKSRYR